MAVHASRSWNSKLILVHLFLALLGPSTASELIAAQPQRGLSITLGGGYNSYAEIDGLGVHGAVCYSRRALLAAATFADLTFFEGQDRLHYGPVGTLTEYAAMADINVLLGQDRMFVGAGRRFDPYDATWYL